MTLIYKSMQRAYMVKWVWLFFYFEKYLIQDQSQHQVLSFKCSFFKIDENFTKGHYLGH